MCMLITVSASTMNDILLALANENSQDIVQGALPVHHEIHSGAFLQIGLDLEEQQSMLFNIDNSRFN